MKKTTATKARRNSNRISLNKQHHLRISGSINLNSKNRFRITSWIFFQAMPLLLPFGLYPFMCWGRCQYPSRQPQSFPRLSSLMWRQGLARGP